MRDRPRVALVAIAAAFLVTAALADGSLLFGSSYPLEARASFPAGLFHFVDSIAGTSVGKTKDAHRGEFLAIHGRPDPEDRRHLDAFVAARYEHMKRTEGLEAGLPVPRRSALLGIFCGAETVEAALGTVRGELSERSFSGLKAALRHFRPKYERIWREASQPRAFLDRVRRDRRRDELAALLGRMRTFYGVELDGAPRPTLALVPVRDGWGTHAEAIGRHLLLEIRPGDDLAGQASVIVHENAHYLWSLLPEPRLARLEAAALEAGTEGEKAWAALREALPTALGQGIADHAFRPDAWSERHPWYHQPDVDAFAKALYAYVNHAIAKGQPLDEAFIRGAVLRYPREIAAPNGRPGGLSRRGP